MPLDSFKGAPVNEEWFLEQLPPIESGRNHTVLFELPIEYDTEKPPTPKDGDKKWDSKHVKLPCATQNECKSTASDSENGASVESKWEFIETALLRNIKSSRELEEAILSYNLEDGKAWKFNTMHALFEQEFSRRERDFFFNNTLPFIIRLALQLPNMIPASIPLLKSGENRSISLSQEQIACLLANAFLCTFPGRNENSEGREYQNYPSVNFGSLFESEGDHNIEKLICICHYFCRVSERMPTGVVTFTRYSVVKDDIPNWDHCRMTFEKSLLHVSADGTIEDDGQGMLQVDFANKKIGGGVLNQGCVQEEIMFMIYPELLCSRLFTEELLKNECLVILGCERFNYYNGYAKTFQWAGSFVDKTFDDEFRRRNCAIVALDAIQFKYPAVQYKDHMLERELNKAFIGFKCELGTFGVATGNWGCGAFNGDKYLKSLLQMMACCVTERPLAYYTFGDERFRNELFVMHEFLSKNKITIADLWRWIKEYEKSKDGTLFNYVMECHLESNERDSNTSIQLFFMAEDDSVSVASPIPKKRRASEKSEVKSLQNDSSNQNYHETRSKSHTLL